MLTAQKGLNGNELTAALNGDLDEDANLDQVLGNGYQKLVLNLSGIQHINSVGVKEWLRYFTPVFERGIPVVFQACSPAIVEQLNLILAFWKGATIASVEAPFFCESCGAEFTSSITQPEWGSVSLSAVCPKCHKDAAFDDFPEEYFSFASHVQK